MSIGPTPRQWKLTPALMRLIRMRYLGGDVGLRELAQEFHVSYGTIHSVVSGAHPAVSGGNLCRRQGSRPNRKATQ